MIAATFAIPLDGQPVPQSIAWVSEFLPEKWKGKLSSEFLLGVAQDPELREKVSGLVNDKVKQELGLN